MCDRVEEAPACPITVHWSQGTMSSYQRQLKVTLPGADGYHDPVCVDTVSRGLSGESGLGIFKGDDKTAQVRNALLRVIVNIKHIPKN